MVCRVRFGAIALSDTFISRLELTRRNTTVVRWTCPFGIGPPALNETDQKGNTMSLADVAINLFNAHHVTPTPTGVNAYFAHKLQAMFFAEHVERYNYVTSYAPTGNDQFLVVVSGANHV